jgi:hypothetical protein
VEYLLCSEDEGTAPDVVYAYTTTTDEQVTISTCEVRRTNASAPWQSLRNPPTVSLVRSDCSC